MRVSVYQIRAHRRSAAVTDAMVRGITLCADTPVRYYEDQYAGTPMNPVAVFYGLEGNMPAIFRDYSAAGHKAIYVDLGYWERRRGGRFRGYHKLVVNARHPNAYFQRREHDGSRAAIVNVAVKPWRIAGSHILLAGMGDKGARAEGFEPEAWERATIEELRKHTDRPIVYRPKPSWKTAKPIEGVGFSSRLQEATDQLVNCHAVVTHHSNVAVDGIVAGIPAFVWGGVAVPMGCQDLSRIEDPPMPDGREQWVNDIAWCQWSIGEMVNGLPWAYLKREGLLT